MPGTEPMHEDAILRLNEEEILARLDGDRELMADLCAMALTELPRMAQSLAEAVRNRDANAVHRAAHRLKGALSLFGGGPHIDDCLALEENSLKQDLSRAEEIFTGLERHLDRFRAAAAALVKESHARSDR